MIGIIETILSFGILAAIGVLLVSIGVVIMIFRAVMRLLDR